jgi:hypothetical protein
MKTIKSLLNYFQLFIGLALIVGGITGLTMPKEKTSPSLVVRVAKKPQPLKIDSVKVVHDSVFVISKKIKKVIIIQDKLIDSELVFNAYYQSFMLKNKKEIEVKKGVSDSVRFKQ